MMAIHFRDWVRELGRGWQGGALGCLAGFLASGWLSGAAIAQAGQACPAPALSRLTQHQVQPGESFATIGSQYGVAPTSIASFNPGVSPFNPPVGRTLTVPPVDGIRTNVSPGTSWQDLAATYGIRADVLFEINGCAEPPPSVVFVPGTPGAIAATPAVNNYTGLSRAPLSGALTVGLAYGWRPLAAGGERQFHSGLDLLAALGTTVVAADAGTVAFAGQQGNYGNLVVINHAGGWQTRYAHLAEIAVQPGQVLAAGSRVGAVGASGQPDLDTAHLHFEVRSQSAVGWVAQDPALHLELEAPASLPWSAQP